MLGPMFPFASRTAATPAARTAMRGVEDDAALPGLAPQGSPLRLVQEFVGDTLVAIRAEKYVLELGALTPQCIRRGWAIARGDLVDRGGKLRAYLSELPEAVRSAALVAYVDEMTAAATGLVDTTGWSAGSPFATPAQNLGPGWENADGDIFTAPLAALGDESPWWNQRFWAYFAAMPAVQAAGVGLGIYFGGVFLFEVLSEYGLTAGHSTIDWNAVKVEILTNRHKRWMQNYMRSFWRQLHTAHQIALSTTDAAERERLLRATDPRDGAMPGLVWDGTMPEDAIGTVPGGTPPGPPATSKPKSSFPWWAVGVSAATLVVLAVTVD
jgi:hypothetical protein